jgi:hypothetical protein
LAATIGRSRLDPPSAASLPITDVIRLSAIKITTKIQNLSTAKGG